MLNARQISVAFGLKPLFDGISLTVSPGDRLGIIGPNGAGKSTLLKLLAGELTPDEGEVRADRGVLTAFVGQHDVFPDGADARSAVVKAGLDGAAGRGLHTDPHQAETVAEILLGKVGFPEELMDTHAATLSGGWRKRLSIAAAMASAEGEPDVLLLDEPTNHLDMQGLTWLEEFITRLTARRSVAVVFISHDRTFLDRVATRIAELSAAYPDGLFAADGNYTAFLRRKAEFLDAQAERQRSLAGQVRKDLAWLSRGPQGRQTKAKGRIDSSHARMGELAGLRDRANAAELGGSRVEFHAGGRKTRKMVVAKGVAKSMGGDRLFHDLNLTLGARDRLGLMGPNGSGKTTLIRVLTGELAPDAGTVELAEPGPVIVTLSQMRRGFDPALPLRDALCPAGDHVNFRGRSVHVKGWARRFLFQDGQLDQPVGSLSGGEIARVHIAQIMLQPSDVLVLDEPTNDLDIPTLEILEEALEDYPGAIVLVTHDRAMLERLSTEVLALDGAGNASLHASVEHALRSSPAGDQPEPAQRPSGSTAPARQPQSNPRPRSVKLSFNEQREYDSIEQDIERAEQLVADAEARMADPAVLADHESMAAVCTELGSAQARVAQLYARWEALEEKRAGGGA